MSIRCSGATSIRESGSRFASVYGNGRNIAIASDITSRCPLSPRGA